MGRLTSKEKIKRFRDKRKNDVQFRQSESKRVEKIRKARVDKMTNAQKEAYREKARERQRKCRAAKRSTNAATSENRNFDSTPTTPITNPYGTKQSYGKALARTRRSLPMSPRKKVAVVAGLASDVGLTLENNMDRNLRKSQGLSDDTKTAVREFYYRPDISYTMPGMNDVMTVWTDNGKTKLRKHYLTLFLREAYHIYSGLYHRDSDKGLAFSTFCDLRPKNVLLLGSSPKDQCKCMIHENLFLKFEAMGISYDSSFWEKALCSTDSNSDCWLSKCDQCNKGKNVVPGKACNSSTTLRQWEKVIVDKNNQLDRQNELDQQGIQTPILENENQFPHQQQKVSSRLQCNSRQIFVGEVLELFQASFPEVCNHVNTKRIQANQFESDKKKPKARVLQMDFAMAYECEYQNEVQSALWTRGSVNLLTAACTVDGQTQTFLICTDSKHKDKNTVLVFVEPLYENYIKNRDDSDDDMEEIIWTDGLLVNSKTSTVWR